MFVNKETILTYLLTYVCQSPSSLCCLRTAQSWRTSGRRTK